MPTITRYGQKGDDGCEEEDSGRSVAGTTSQDRETGEGPGEEGGGQRDQEAHEEACRQGLRDPSLEVEARRVPDDERDEELAEAWTRDIADPHVRYVHGVEASKHGAEVAWPWRLTVWVMEYVRDDQLQVELRQAIGTALRKAPGVTGVAEEDREVWVVAGSPSGAALVSAVAEVVDRFADRTREHVWSR